MANQDWINDSSLKDISRVKLEFLGRMVFETESLSAKERLPFLMALAARSKAEKISFTDDEVSRIVAVIQRNSSAEDIVKMNQIIKLFGAKK